MAARSPARDGTGTAMMPSPGLGAERRTIGRAAGALISLSAVVTIATMRILSNRTVPGSFDVVVVVSMCSGLICLLVPWNTISPRWLHLIPMIGTIEIALGIRLAGVYGDIASNYFVFVAVFSAYAFASRVEVAAQVGFTAIASILPIFYDHTKESHTPARSAVGVLSLVIVSVVVTLLREGLQRRQQELEELAVRDPLTGVGNYRLLSDRLAYEIARHGRSGGSLTVMLLDLDGFKEINDTFGHLVGDRVLIEVARGIDRTLRSQDTLARQGGDEFSILAPETDGEHAIGLARRVEEAVSAATNGSVTTSVGWVTFPDQAEDADSLLSLADTELRGSKARRGGSGRGRVTDRGGLLRLVETADIAASG
jgi:diguanylate cyclase (GGDEF)-like protein